MKNLQEITMINVDKLHPHPDNPRKDIGDITELADSIRQKGILQNLTVVPETGYYHGEYTVVIGHRRLAAAKAAGLEAVPCVVCEMTQEEQIETMLLENIQREELKPLEQAVSFQMLLDMGSTVKEVSEKTGFSESTVRRRTRILTLPKDTFEEVKGRQINLGDWDRLFDEIKDEDLRNDALKDIGTRNFDFKLSQAKSTEKKRAEFAHIKDKLRTFANEMDEVPEAAEYVTGIYSIKDAEAACSKYAESDSVYWFIPKSAYYTGLYRELAPQEIAAKKLEDEEKAKKEAAEIERMESLRELRERFFELRRDFVMNKCNARDHNAILKLIMGAAVTTGWRECDCDLLYDAYGVEPEEDGNDERFADFQHEFTKNPWRFALLAGYAMYGDDNKGFHNWKGGHKENNSLAILYDALAGLGYEIADEEMEYMNGTHELFLREDAAV